MRTQATITGDSTIASGDLPSVDHRMMHILRTSASDDDAMHPRRLDVIYIPRHYSETRDSAGQPSADDVCEHLLNRPSHARMLPSSGLPVKIRAFYLSASSANTASEIQIHTLMSQHTSAAIRPQPWRA
ncbi:uncharacterized protein LOC105184659 [Harpegnathos saltator]|uniref:uncharacterized protein LOC105184659 n=1 Tax=Harpegnathos saltator TaxID=610380 RepID=UPI00059006F0|nr:uncharacterized protein LOC105184659 [Harpegnathos saltator]